MKRYITTLLTFAIAAAGLYAQPRFNNEQYLNYRGNELLINPAVLGGIRETAIGLGLQKQWLHVDGSPLAATLQYQQPLAGRSGVGAWAYNETYGVQNNLQIGAAYAYTLPLASGTLSFALSASGLLMSDKLVAGHNPDPLFTEALGTLVGFNAGFGAYYQSNRYYIGLSIPQLLTNDISGNKLSNGVAFDRMSFYLTGGYHFDVNSAIRLTPSALLQLSGATALGYEALLTATYAQRWEVSAGYDAHTNVLLGIGGIILPNLSLRYQFAQQLGDNYRHMGSSHFLTVRYVLGAAN